MKRLREPLLSEIPLLPVPSAEWQEEYDGLTGSKRPIVVANGYFYLGDWLARKTNRERRLKEINQYVEQHAEEILKRQHGTVIDIGPGPGEFLEIARHCGHPVIGVDAASGEGGMGLGYLRLSQLMTDRQKIPVEYIGFRAWLSRDDTTRYSSASFVNFRGSIEQALSHRMHGDHRARMDCRFLHWKEDGETRDAFTSMFARLRLYLQPGGCVLIHANGSASDEWYDGAIQLAAREVGFVLLKREGQRLHKWGSP